MSGQLAVLLIFAGLLSLASAMHCIAAEQAIRPYKANPFYWQYKGQPIVLRGGTGDHNLFQWTGSTLTDHLDLLVSVGGNYVRNTMSCRERDKGNVWPFYQISEGPDAGKFDLTRSNEEFWERFEFFLQETAKRDIIVQIEVWDRFDYFREPWQVNPFRPDNNINYTSEDSTLANEYPNHPGGRGNPFFTTPPELDDNPLVRQYQEALIDKMLSYSLKHGHVLYCISNETNESPHWGAYWARRIRSKAAEMGVEVHVTEMWDAWDVRDATHRNTIDHPDLYSFVDLSQNNQKTGQSHWENPQAVRQRIIESGRIRPINSVKVYGADGGRWGTTRDGTERFWRNLIGGFASVRFHRPPSGIGLSETAQAHLKSADMLLETIDVLSMEPRMDLMSGRETNEAYLLAEPGRQYAVYFPDGGEVRLDLSNVEGPDMLRWLEIERSRWHSETKVEGGSSLRLAAPGNGHWMAVVVIQKR